MSIDVKVGQMWRFEFPHDFIKCDVSNNVSYNFKVEKLVNNNYEAVGDVLYDDGVILNNVTYLIESMKTVCYWSLIEENS